MFQDTDNRVSQKKPLTPSFLYATLLLRPLFHEWNSLQPEGLPKMCAFDVASKKVLYHQSKCTAIPRRTSKMIREIWALQHRLEKKQSSKTDHLTAHPRFRASYDLLLLRAKSGENVQSCAKWWTKFQEKR